MTFSIYLTFEDNCREVFEFYRSVFGGEFDTLQTFGDGPADMGVSEEARAAGSCTSRCPCARAC